MNVWSAARLQGKNSKEEVSLPEMCPALVEMNLRALDEMRVPVLLNRAAVKDRLSTQVLRRAV